MLNAYGSCTALLESIGHIETFFYMYTIHRKRITRDECNKKNFRYKIAVCLRAYTHGPCLQIKEREIDRT